ncbi:LPD29 domain-containing protein [Luteococcus sp. H138]|uniref:LPD29 domain-containing protein n=1 Tax=unclassified Luteococcus TaxID=2639923 RepID=UPI00313EFDC1
MTITPQEKLSVKETAAAMRKALRQQFPETKFRVTMSRGTGYGWIDVRWTDGPTSEQVRAVTRQFQDSYFDGMDDSYHSIQGRPYRCCGVTDQRDYSPERKQWADAQVTKNETTGEWWIPGVQPPIFAPYPHADRELVAYQLLYRESF